MKSDAAAAGAGGFSFEAAAAAEAAGIEDVAEDASEDMYWT